MKQTYYGTFTAEMTYTVEFEASSLEEAEEIVGDPVALSNLGVLDWANAADMLDWSGYLNNDND